MTLKCSLKKKLLKLGGTMIEMKGMNLSTLGRVPGKGVL